MNELFNYIYQGLQTLTDEGLGAIFLLEMSTLIICALWELLDYAQYYICHKRYHDKQVRRLLEQIERNKENDI